jgi:hypothetical protein
VNSKGLFGHTVMQVFHAALAERCTDVVPRAKRAMTRDNIPQLGDSR